MTPRVPAGPESSPPPVAPAQPAPAPPPVPQAAPAPAPPLRLVDLEDVPEPPPLRRRPAPVSGFRPPYGADRRRRPGLPLLAIAAAGVAGLLLLLLVVVPGLVHLAQR